MQSEQNISISLIWLSLPALTSCWSILLLLLPPFPSSCSYFLLILPPALLPRYLDTIHSETGQLNTISALNLIVFGPKLEHLDLIEFVIVDLLKVGSKAAEPEEAAASLTSSNNLNTCSEAVL